LQFGSSKITWFLILAIDGEMGHVAFGLLAFAPQKG
jgi:hypothetical protein